MAITKEEQEKMLIIAEPFLMDAQADPLEKNAAKLLLNRIKNKSIVGKLIMELMVLSQRHLSTLPKAKRHNYRKIQKNVKKNPRYNN